MVVVVGDVDDEDVVDDDGELVGDGVMFSGFDEEGGGVDDSARAFSTGAFLSADVANRRRSWWVMEREALIG